MKIFWDTNLFVYPYEEDPQFMGRVEEIRRTMLERGDRLCTSCLSVGEMLIKPEAARRNDLVARFQAFSRYPSLTVSPLILLLRLTMQELSKMGASAIPMLSNLPVRQP